jgi:Spy/CpxP family protein refolding chaperone
MNKLACVLAALAIAACDNETVAPPQVDVLFDDGGILAYDAAGVSGPGRYLSGLHRLPPELRLTEAQSAAIKAAFDAFHKATAADREALAKILEAANQARRAGKSRAEVAAILATGDPIRERILGAERALQAKIESILTAEQKAWLDANLPKVCDPRAAPKLNEAQITEIRALLAAYEQANRADLEAVKAALEKARAAQQNGATRDQINAILHSVQPAMERLAAAQAALLKAIDALLTPEQRASGCYRGGHLVGAGGRRP